MALRAGYVGVKRRLYEALTKESAENKQSIEDIFKINGKTGAKNIFKLGATSGSNNNVSWVVNSDGTITITIGEEGASADTYIALNPGGVSMVAGSYIFNGCPAGGSQSAYSMFFRSTSTTSPEFGYDTGSGRSMVLDSTKTIVGYILIKNGTKSSTSLLFKPMIRYAGDANYEYEIYAMTNQQLTASADDQKTAINAIISAATGAADFAAFKTAMAAITPVTRSAAPAERSLDVEEDEPVVVKKTTRKKTTKTEEEE